MKRKMVQTLNGRMSFENNLRRLEEKIRYTQGKERALYIDGYGNVIFDSDKAKSDTDPTHVWVDNNDEWGLLSAVAIHSHPTFYYADWYWGSTFSPEDIFNAMSNNFKEIRFCDKYFTGILTRGGKYWRNDWGRKWDKSAFKKLQKEWYNFGEKYGDKFKKGEIKISDYLPNYLHWGMEDFARKHGLDYRREQRHPLPPLPDFKKTIPKKDLKTHPNLWLE